jgi:hypothetical protein
MGNDQLINQHSCSIRKYILMKESDETTVKDIKAKTKNIFDINECIDSLNMKIRNGDSMVVIL